MKDDCVLLGTIYAFDNSRPEAEVLRSATEVSLGGRGA